jgi:hypothetical protein
VAVAIKGKHVKRRLPFYVVYLFGDTARLRILEAPKRIKTCSTGWSRSNLGVARPSRHQSLLREKMSSLDGKLDHH